MTIRADFVDAFGNTFPAAEFSRKPGENNLGKIRRFIQAHRKACSGMLRREHGFKGAIKTKLTITK